HLPAARRMPAPMTIRTGDRVAFLCLAATQGIFWTFTYPMNVPATSGRSHRQTSKQHGASGSIRTPSTPLDLCGVGVDHLLDAHPDALTRNDANVREKCGRRADEVIE